MTGEAAARPGFVARLRVVVLAAGVAAAVLGFLCMLAGPLAYRSGLLGYEAATAGVGRTAMLLFGSGLGLAVVGTVLSFTGRKQRGAITGILTVVLGGYGFGQFWGQDELRRSLPPIHDVQTDWNDPVTFSPAVLQERQAAEAAPVGGDDVLGADAGRWAGRKVSDVQKEAYDLSGAVVDAPVERTTAAFAEAAERQGWIVVMSNPPVGELEATMKTFWYGLTSDMAVRVRAEGAEGKSSRIDVRITSREPGSDMGANAQRLNALLRDVAFAVRGGS